MKKSLIALALMGAFSGAAVAQSNVTLYGILDVNYMWQDLPTTVGTGTAARVQLESVDGINSGHQSGNRWGLRGSEALGGGLSAIFTIEQGFSLDTGQASSTRAFHRQAWLGLSGNMGSVVAGRLATFSSGTGSFDMIGRIDPFLTGFGLASAGNTFYSMNALRADNTIAYVSPTWAGFKGGIGYSFNVNGTENADSSLDNSAIIAGANWSSGPFFAAITYDSVDVASSDKDQKHLQIGGTWDIATFRLHAGWAKQDDVQAVSTAIGGSGAFLGIPAGASFDSTSWLLGVTWHVTSAFDLLASYQALNADGQTRLVGTTPVNFEPDYNVWAFGATYNLSRRTNLYASYASRNADGTLLDNSFNAKQLAVGIRHLF